MRLEYTQLYPNVPASIGPDLITQICATRRAALGSPLSKRWTSKVEPSPGEFDAGVWT